MNENLKSNFRSSQNFAGNPGRLNSQARWQQKLSPVVSRGGKRNSHISETPVTFARYYRSWVERLCIQVPRPDFHSLQQLKLHTLENQKSVPYAFWSVE
ncbi:hypothetical protein TNCV_121481 [Trichonephila clavipes]|nr:hypothetical protein TNCV_121481 [Trichonephila clavipes]